MASLRGNLRDFGIAEVFQLIGQQGKTGRLEVRSGQARIAISFDGGSVVCGHPGDLSQDAAMADRLVREGWISQENATAWLDESRAAAVLFDERVCASGLLCEAEFTEVRERLTRNLLFDLLRWREGRFEFISERRVNGLVGRGLSSQQVLMDGMRRADEWNASGAERLEPNGLFRVAADASGDQGEGRSTSEVGEKILGAMDGEQTVRDVIDLARVDFFDGMLALAELEAAGWIQPVSQPRPGPSVPVSAPWRQGGLAAAFPVLLLAALVGLLVFSPLGPKRVATAWEAPVDEARVLFESQQRRNEQALRRFDLVARRRFEQASAGPVRTERDALAGGGVGLYTSPGDESPTNLVSRR